MAKRSKNTSPIDRTPPDHEPAKTQCRRCGSTECSEGSVLRVFQHSHVIEEQERNRVIWHRVRCLGCGQVRTERSSE